MKKKKCVVCYGENSHGQCFYCAPLPPEPIKRNPGYFKTPEMVDKMVCDWSMSFCVAMTEKAQIALVDLICSRYLNDSPPIVNDEAQY